MPSIDEVNIHEGLMAQFVGPPGTGKSIAMASFVKERGYIFDLDSRIESVCAFWAGKKKIDFDIYQACDFEKFAKKLESFQINCPYDMIGIAGLTALADMLLQYGIALRGRGKAGSKSVGVIDLNTIEDYNVETRGLMQVISVLRALKGKTRILETHLLSAEYQALDGTTRVQRSTLTGGKKISPKIPGYFNEVWQFSVKPGLLSTEKPKFLVKTINDGDNLGKTILPLPMEMDWTRGPDNPDGNLFKVVQDNLRKAGINV
jgi:hypothetical protein